MPKADETEVRATFAEIVNMTPREIERWHATEESKSVGQDSGDGVSVGVKAGQRTIQLLRIKRVPNADDIKHMRRVVNFIRRQLTLAPRQEPRNLALALRADELGPRSAEDQRRRQPLALTGCTD